MNSHDVNTYLHQLTDCPFTAKDFRTWVACREMFCRLVSLAKTDTHPTTRILNLTITEVAELLGHTRQICQKNYINPRIIEHWQNGKLGGWIQLERKKIQHLTDDELLLYWLESGPK